MHNNLNDFIVNNIQTKQAAEIRQVKNIDCISYLKDLKSTCESTALN